MNDETPQSILVLPDLNNTFIETVQDAIVDDSRQLIWSEIAIAIIYGIADSTFGTISAHSNECWRYVQRYEDNYNKILLTF